MAKSSAASELQDSSTSVDQAAAELRVFAGRSKVLGRPLEKRLMTVCVSPGLCCNSSAATPLA